MVIMSGKKKRKKEKRKNRRVNVSISQTINTGDFNSIRIQAGIGFDISNNDNLDDAYDEAFDEITNQILKYRENINV